VRFGGDGERSRPLNRSRLQAALGELEACATESGRLSESPLRGRLYTSVPYFTKARQATSCHSGRTPMDRMSP